MSAEPHDEHARPVGALYTAVLFIVTILSGSYFIMALKFCDQTSAIGLGTEPHLFSHPLFQPIGKFFGSALWFVAYYAWKRFSRAARRRQELDDLGPHSRQVDYTPEESQSESESDSDEWFVSGQVGSRDRVSEPGYARPGSQHRSSQERPEFSNWLFVMPAALDWFGSSMAYVGMMFTTASTFQLLRDCALLIFLVLLGLCFYGKLLKVWQGAGMFILLIGAVLVFFSSVLSPASTALELAPEPLLGNTLVIVSQFFVATHLLVEQKLVREYNVSPLLIVGWQGVFGFLITVVMQVIYYFLPGKTYGGRLENALDAIMQVNFLV
jgi:drug/metabolite transporter (DMT)-like permease